MALVKCKKGHYYDNAKYDDCPMCNSPITTEEKTISFFDVMKSDDEKTISVNMKKNNNTSPVTGWFVCTEGEERGRDFRIHTGRNFIGRGYDNDIVLTGDKEINIKMDCSVIYEPRKNEFIIMNEEGSNVYVNGQPILNPTVISEQDIIVIGSYTFAFVAYCKGDIRW